VSLLLSLVWWPSRPAAQSITEHHVTVIAAVTPALFSIPSPLRVVLTATDHLCHASQHWALARSIPNAYGLVCLVRAALHLPASKPHIPLAAPAAHLVCGVVCSLASLVAETPESLATCALPIAIDQLMCDVVACLPLQWIDLIKWLTREFRTRDPALSLPLACALQWILRSSSIPAMDSLRSSPAVTKSLVAALPSSPLVASVSLAIRTDIAASANIFTDV